MKVAKFYVTCTAQYESELQIPSELTDDEDILEYIRDNLQYCNVSDLEWISDWEPDVAVEEVDIINVEEY